MTQHDGRLLRRDPEIQSELRRRQDEWLHGIVENDVDLMRAVLHEDWLYTDFTGHTHSHAVYLAMIDELIGEDFETSLEEFEAYVLNEDLAIARGRYILNGTLGNGSKNEQNSRFTSVWIRDAGRWRMLAHQATNVIDLFPDLPASEQAFRRRSRGASCVNDAGHGGLEIVGVEACEGTRGVLVRLSGVPSELWARLLPEVWNMPAIWGPDHPLGIARVAGDAIVLDAVGVARVRDQLMPVVTAVIDELNYRVADIARR